MIVINDDIKPLSAKEKFNKVANAVAFVENTKILTKQNKNENSTDKDENIDDIKPLSAKEKFNKVANAVDFVEKTKILSKNKKENSDDKDKNGISKEELSLARDSFLGKRSQTLTDENEDNVKKINMLQLDKNTDIGFVENNV
jgi:hypothetical protein